MRIESISATAEDPGALLSRLGSIFAIFNASTQDSGNVSYGFEIEASRYFVKTAGAPTDRAFLAHDMRVHWLRNAVRVNEAVRDPVIPRLLNVIESPHGPMLVYKWVAGELVGVPGDRRSDPDSPFQRFKSLPLTELIAALTSVFRIHVELCARGWIASDFYDGAMMYDFEEGRLRLVDLDLYRDAPFRNEMGRMFGSKRFMAPEEFELGALIDERTTVFNMGRCIEIFVGDRAGDATTSDLRALLSIAKRACRQEREQRWPSMAAFYAAWLYATAIWQSA